MTWNHVVWPNISRSRNGSNGPPTDWTWPHGAPRPSIIPRQIASPTCTTSYVARYGEYSLMFGFETKRELRDRRQKVEQRESSYTDSIAALLSSNALGLLQHSQWRLRP